MNGALINKNDVYQNLNKRGIQISKFNETFRSVYKNDSLFMKSGSNELMDKGKVNYVIDMILNDKSNSVNGFYKVNNSYPQIQLNRVTIAQTPIKPSPPLTGLTSPVKTVGKAKSGCGCGGGRK